MPADALEAEMSMKLSEKDFIWWKSKRAYDAEQERQEREAKDTQDAKAQQVARQFARASLRGQALLERQQRKAHTDEEEAERIRLTNLAHAARERELVAASALADEKVRAAQAKKAIFAEEKAQREAEAARALAEKRRAEKSANTAQLRIAEEEEAERRRVAIAVLCGRLVLCAVVVGDADMPHIRYRMFAVSKTADKNQNTLEDVEKHNGIEIAEVYLRSLGGGHLIEEACAIARGEQKEATPIATKYDPKETAQLARQKPSVLEPEAGQEPETTCKSAFEFWGTKRCASKKARDQVAAEYGEESSVPPAVEISSRPAEFVQNPAFAEIDEKVEIAPATLPMNTVVVEVPSKIEDVTQQEELVEEETTTVAHEVVTVGDSPSISSSGNEVDHAKDTHNLYSIEEETIEELSYDMPASTETQIETAEDNGWRNHKPDIELETAPTEVVMRSKSVKSRSRCTSVASLVSVAVQSLPKRRRRWGCLCSSNPEYDEADEPKNTHVSAQTLNTPPCPQ